MGSPRRKLRIVTDSAARISAAWAAEHDVIVLPHGVHLDGRAMREDIDISDSDLAAWAASSDVPFSVSAPTVEDFARVYIELADARYDMISIHISGAMSDTVKNARKAAEEVSGRCALDLIDSRTIATGLHMLVKTAVEMVEAGSEREIIVRRLRGLMQGIYGIFVSDDMAFLGHSGRLRPAQSVLGHKLEIIPCLSMEEGELVAVEKVRSPEKAIEKLAEFALEFEPDAHYSILQMSPAPGAKSRALIEALKPGLARASAIGVQSCGASVSSIIGLSGVGIMIFEGDKR